MQTKPRAASVQLSANGESQNGDLYRIDRKGDQQNLIYGALSTYTVPRYKLKGRGNLIGLDRQYLTASRSEKGCEVSAVDVDWSRKYREKYMVAIPSIRVSEHLKPATHEDQRAFFEQNYLPLCEKRSRKRRRLSRTSTENASPSCSESSDSDNWSKDGRKDGTAPENAAYEAFRDNPIRRRHEELFQATVEEPEQIENWLALVVHQENVFDILWTDQGQHDPSRERKIIDLKISIYQKALSKVHNQSGRDRLIIGLLREGSKVWDNSRQRAEWQRHIKDESSFDLRVSYANFMQTNNSSFSSDLCVDLYTRQLETFSSHPASTQRDLRLLYLLLRVSTYLLQAGFVERAVALWQATLEFNLTAQNFATSSEELAAFEAFWDDGKPRIGESGVTCWWYERHDESITRVDRSSLPINGQDLFGSWATAEKEAADVADLPARPLDEVDENDPYKVIMFSDISPLLFKISSTGGNAILINTFLIFCGLSPFSTDSDVNHWTQDEFSSPNQVSFRPGDDGSTSSNIGNVILDFRPNPWILFAAKDKPYSVWRAQSHFQDQLNSHWVQQTLQQLVLAFWENEDFSVYVIAVLLSVQPKSARKFAKLLLKRSPDSLSLYNAYAYVECRLDNTLAAERVWSTAIRMSGSLDQPGNNRTVLLWHGWIWECLESQQISKAERLLSKLADGKVDIEHLENQSSEQWSTPVALLRVEGLLQSHLSDAVSSEHQKNIPMYTDLLALTRYFQADRSLSSALAVYSNVVDSVSRSRISHVAEVLEDLHQFRVRILYAHVELFRSGFRPKEVLRTLEESLASYPQNSLFSTFYQQYQKKAGILDKIHSGKMYSFSLNSLAASILAIKIAIEKSTYSGRTEHSTRAAFRNATGYHSPARRSPSIWKAFILWEVSLISEETIASEKFTNQTVTKAKEAFYNAIGACPWAKNVYMLAFSEKQMRKILGDQALKHLYQSMLERGIRIHIDIKDLLPVH